MKFIILITFSGFLMISGAQVPELKTTIGPSHGKIVVCPVPTQSAIAIIGNKLKIDRVDWNLCTHLMALDSKFLSYNDMTEKDKEEDYKQLTNLREKYPHLKIYLESRIEDYFADFLEVVGNPIELEKYIKSIVDSVKKYKFDGLDLNWGDIQLRLPHISNSEKLILLLKNLKETFEQEDPNLLLTSSFSIPREFLANDFNYAAPVEHLDYVHLLPIDFDTDTFDKYNISTVRDELNTLSVQEKVDNLIESGVPVDKIIMGVMFGGLSFYSSFSGISQKFDKLNGYSTICETIKADEWQIYYDSEIDFNYALYKNEEKNEKNIIIYGESRMVANQMRFMVRRKLAGTAAVTLDRDDFRGNCPIENDTYEDFETYEGVSLLFPDRNETTFPLLRTINEAITVSLDELFQLGKGNASLVGINIYMIFVLICTLMLSLLSF